MPSTWPMPPPSQIAPSPYGAAYGAAPAVSSVATPGPVDAPSGPGYEASLALAPHDGQNMGPHAGYAPAPSPFYFSHLLPVKLTPDNYLSWRAQVLPLLRSRYLEGYVDGFIPCPPPYHPAHHVWVAQDQAILSAIQSSLTPSISSLVIFAATSRDA